MRYCPGNVRHIRDASIEIARIHALCDIINEYSNYSSEERRTVDNNVGFAMQVVHDLVAELDSDIERLAMQNPEENK